MDDLERAYHFVGQAAHDLRNPIAVIAGAASLLQQRWDRLSEELRREQVDSIADHARRLRELTDALLDWASIETGKLRVHLEPVDLREIIERAVIDAASGYPVEIRVASAKVMADPRHLGRVLTNLLVNARKYGAPPVLVEGTAGDDEVVVTVADYGPGVPKEIADSLFEPFVRGGRAGDGAGLGLAIVRGLVEVQGGRVWYERADPGSAFRVALRAARN